MCNELIGQPACLACGGHPHIFRWIFELGLGPPPHQNVQATHSSQGSQAGTHPPKQAGQGLGQPRKRATRAMPPTTSCPQHPHTTPTQAGTATTPACLPALPCPAKTCPLPPLAWPRDTPRPPLARLGLGLKKNPYSTIVGAPTLLGLCSPHSFTANGVSPFTWLPCTPMNTHLHHGPHLPPGLWMLQGCRRALPSSHPVACLGRPWWSHPGVTL